MGKYSREQRDQLRRLGQSDNVVIFDLGRHCGNRLLTFCAVVRSHALGRTNFRTFLGLFRHGECVGWYRQQSGEVQNAEASKNREKRGMNETASWFLTTLVCRLYQEEQYLSGIGRLVDSLVFRPTWVVLNECLMRLFATGDFGTKFLLK